MPGPATHLDSRGRTPCPRIPQARGLSLPSDGSTAASQGQGVFVPSLDRELYPQSLAHTRGFRNIL